MNVATQPSSEAAASLFPRLRSSSVPLSASLFPRLRSSSVPLSASAPWDPVTKKYKGHDASNLGKNDLAAWYDGNLNYQVPRS